ncbi:MAG: DUF2231 domain-containing protein [Gammaproteobacteria bacterium]|nr:DUF2231 domain-containing protein [Gammaproteobacteria bacterium]
MPDIIPNWHPVFVHFTVALCSLAAGLFAITPFVKPPLQQQWQIVARWALWFGGGFTIITGLTGLYAYNTVTHDTPSHVAMTDHRNWALATITLFVALAVWSMVRVRRNQALGTVFIAVMIIAGGVLAATAWRGAEVVFRYGVGVMSLPRPEGAGHVHEHASADQPPGNEVDNAEQQDHHDDDDAHDH